MDAYLLVMSGQGDRHGKLVDLDVWNWLEDGPITDSMVDDYYHQAKVDDHTLTPELARAKLENASSYSINDKALFIHGSRFDGESYDVYGFSIRDLNKFVKKHDIDIVAEWEGYIY